MFSGLEVESNVDDALEKLTSEVKRGHQLIRGVIVDLNSLINFFASMPSLERRDVGSQRCDV